MRLLNVAVLVSVFASQGVLAQNVYDTQFQTIKSMKIVELTEDENGFEQEVVVHDQKVNELSGFDTLKDDSKELITREDLERFLDRRGKDSKEEPTKTEESKESKEKPKTEEAKESSEPKEESTADGIIKIVDKLIAVGKKVYTIVASGKPQLSMSSNPVSIVPMDDNGKMVAPFMLENWEEPRSKKFRVTIENYMGIDVVDFEFMVIFSYGGSFAGSGKYITSAQVKPTYVDVTWGFTFDVNCSLQSIMNRGTKENPVAGALLMLDYRVVTVIQERVVNKTFFIDGLGNLKVH